MDKHTWEAREKAPCTRLQVACNIFCAALMCAVFGSRGVSVESHFRSGTADTRVVFRALKGAWLSPVADSILQLIEDSAVQGVNIRQLIENLPKPLFVQHGFPLLPNRSPHRFPEVLAHVRIRMDGYVSQSSSSILISQTSSLSPFFPHYSAVLQQDNIWQYGPHVLLYQDTHGGEVVVKVTVSKSRTGKWEDSTFLFLLSVLLSCHWEDPETSNKWKWNVPQSEHSWTTLEPSKTILEVTAWSNVTGFYTNMTLYSLNNYNIIS